MGKYMDYVQMCGFWICRFTKFSKTKSYLNFLYLFYAITKEATGEKNQNCRTDKMKSHYGYG
jgi:hypothetical protein